MKTQPTNVVEIIETEIFSKDVKNFLSDVEQSALHIFLGNNPFEGKPVPRHNGLLYIQWNKHVTVMYTTTKDVKCIFLVSIQSSNDEKINKEDRKTSKRILGRLRDAGIGWAVKEVLDFISKTIDRSNFF